MGANSKGERGRNITGSARSDRAERAGPKGQADRVRRPPPPRGPFPRRRRASIIASHAPARFRFPRRRRPARAARVPRSRAGGRGPVPGGGAARAGGGGGRGGGGAARGGVRRLRGGTGV